MKKYRFHLLGLVHLPVSERYMACAFTQKVVKLSKMLLSLGHEVYLYGAETSDAPCTEFIPTHSMSDIRRSFGNGDNRFELGYDWKLFGFHHDFAGARTQATKQYYVKAIEQINKRKQPDDFLLLSQGYYQKPISDAVGLILTCEPGIGYRGSMPTSYRAFESSYLQNFTYGSEHPFESINGNYYDRVIPNYFDPKDFTFSEQRGDYYLYIGRIVRRKGVWTAIEATRALGKKLILVGQTFNNEVDVQHLPEHCEYHGFADPEMRKKLLSEAIATFTPTTYLEAFAGTHVESMISGVPPITTNFGVYPGTIPDHLNGVIGFRCNTLKEFVAAGKEAAEMTVHERKGIATYAKRFLMDTVKWEFQQWFDDLYDLYRSRTIAGEKAWSKLQ